MHFNFVSPFDYPEYKPQDGDTWTDFVTGQWDETGTVKTGEGLVERRFSNGEWREYDAAAEMPPHLRKLLDEARAEPKR